METNVSINLYKKLLVFQKSVEAIKKENRNDHFKSKYLNIDDLLSEVKPKLNAAGLIVIQMMQRDSLVSRIIDVDTGEFIEAAMTIPAMNKAQETGSYITYARRYSLQALLGLEGEDDDGNTASGRSTPPPSGSSKFGSGKFGGKS
jgi:hypothetical protein